MSCYNSVVVPAPAEQVWAKLRDFHDMSWATGVVESCEAVGDIPGTQIGARRVLNNVFHETLHALDEVDRLVRYSIDDGPEAVARDKVTNYIGEVRVFPVTETNSSFVRWTSTWDDSRGGVAEFCNPIYMALLDALKKHFA
jgi:hypothetical protein